MVKARKRTAETTVVKMREETNVEMEASLGLLSDIIVVFCLSRGEGWWRVSESRVSEWTVKKESERASVGKKV
jgi:hypothetical protein